MPVFHVYLNGKKVSTAGVGDIGVLSAHVTWVRRTQEDMHVKMPEEELTLHVGGLISPKEEHVRWLDRRLQLGDEVRITVAESASIDRPRTRKRRNRAQELRAQKRYVREMAKRFGWKIQTRSWNGQPFAAANGLSAIRSRVAGVGEHTVRSTRVAEAVAELVSRSMASELAIMTFAAGVLAFVYAISRPRGDSAQPSRLAALFTTARSGVPRLLALRERRDRKCFLVGVAAGALFAVFCNLVPFFYTYGAYGTDSVEAIGFPLAFRSAGGFVFSTHFRWLCFLADLLFATFLSFVGGYAAIGVRTLFQSQGHHDDREKGPMG
jgi:hypothetical protein